MDLKQKEQYLEILRQDLSKKYKYTSYVETPHPELAFIMGIAWNYLFLREADIDTIDDYRYQCHLYEDHRCLFYEYLDWEKIEEYLLEQNL